MQKFRAFRIDRKDGRHHAGFETIALDQLSEGDVVIKALYSGINYKDALAATGKGDILRKFPLVGGVDVSGLVEQSCVPEFRKGDPVLVCGCGLSETLDGGYADYVRVPADCVVPLPATLSLYEAMAIGSAGFSAALALDTMQLNGQTPGRGPIIVTGASGGVGSYSIDLLSGAGFRVVAITGKPECRDYLESLGAAEVLIREDLELGTRPLEKGLWGGAIDSVGGDLLAWLTRTVKPRGNIASIGLAAGVNLKTTVFPFILRGINLLGINSVFCPAALKKKIWNRLAGDLRPRHINTIVNHVIPLEKIPDVFQDYLNSAVIGRTVVKIAAG
ncbi:MAG: oxidoreductase [Gammaproteobacteria bacterium]